MKNAEEIRIEVNKLIGRLSYPLSDGALYEIAGELFEYTVLLKHLSPIDSESNTKATHPTDVATTEPAKPAFKYKAEKNQVVADLFSSEIIHQPSLSSTKEEKNISKIAAESIPGAEKSVAEKQLHKKIADLKTFIGINEKFQFINQLFDGNMKEYNAAVDHLNSVSNYSEAESYTANLKNTYKWADDDNTASHFRELVERRFQ